MQSFWMNLIKLIITFQNFCSSCKINATIHPITFCWKFYYWTDLKNARKQTWILYKMYWKTFPHRSTPVINQILLNIRKKKKNIYISNIKISSHHAKFTHIFQEFLSLNLHCYPIFFYYHSSDNLQRQEHARQSILILYIVYWKNTSLPFNLRI